MPLGSTQQISCQQFLTFSIITFREYQSDLSYKDNEQSTVNIICTTSTTSIIVIVITRNVENYKSYHCYTMEWSYLYNVVITLNVISICCYTPNVLIVITQNYNNSYTLFTTCYNTECSYFLLSLYSKRLGHQGYNAEC